MLALKDPPEAIFVAEDSMAIGTLKAVRERGLRIPRDIALVGANNFEIANFVDPGLTTVYTSAKELGITAMEMTVRLIAGEKINQPSVVLPTRLVIRQSCGCTGESVGSSQVPDHASLNKESDVAKGESVPDPSPDTVDA